MLQRLNKFERQRKVLVRAISIAEKNHCKEELGQALFSLGDYYISLGNIEIAMPYLTRAEVAARTCGNRELVSRCLVNIVHCLIEQDKYKEAIEKVEETYIFNPTLKIQLSKYINFGRIYFKLSMDSREQNKTDHFKTSKKNYELGLTLAKKINSMQDTFVCLSNLGYLHVCHHMCDEAIKYLDEASNNAVTWSDKRLLYQNYAKCFMMRFVLAENKKDCARLVEAEKWLEKTEESYNKIWEELKLDFDKITFSDQSAYYSLTHLIQCVKWLRDKKLEALVALTPPNNLCVGLSIRKAKVLFQN